MTETLFTLPDKVSGMKTTTKTNAAIAEKIAKAKAALVWKDNYKIVGKDATLGSVAKDISRYKIFAFDTETGGLNVWKDPLYCISIWCGGVSYLINFSHPMLPMVSKDEFVHVLADYFVSNNYRRVGFNYKFDAHAISNNLPITVGPAYFDGFVAVWLLDEREERKGLKPLCEKYLKIPLDNYDEQFGKTAWAVIDPAVAADYACKDAELHFRLYEWQDSELKKMPKVHKIMYDLEMPFANMMLETEREGIKVDTDYLKDELRLRLEMKLMDLDKQMAQSVNKKWTTLDGIVDINSPAKTSDFLFNYLKLPRINGDHTGVSVLEELEPKHKIISPLMEYRKTLKLKTSFQEALLERVIEGRIHPSFKSIGTETGRPAGVEPNLNQIPARSYGDIESSVIRQAFLADEGFVLVSKDFSGQELRIQAGVSGDTKLKQLILDGVDFYSYCAAICYGGKWQDYGKTGENSQKRDKAKRAVLAMSYGAQCNKIAWVLGCNKSLAQKFIDDFDSEFPQLSEFQKAQIAFARKHGYIETFLGRRQRIIFRPDDPPGLVARNERLCKNRWVQAGAADQIKLAFVLCWNHCKNNNYLSRPVWEIYDEIIFKIAIEELQSTVLTEIDTIMTECIDIGIPFKTSTEIYPERWGIVGKVAA